MQGEEIRDALKIELICRARERMRLSLVFEVFHLLAGRLQAIQHIARPFVRYGFVGGAPVDLDWRSNILQMGEW